MVELLQENFLISSVEPIQKSLQKTTYLRKFYVVDTGFLYLLDKRSNYGTKLENIVYLELKNKKNPIYYYKQNNKECDFIVKDIYKNKIISAIQVTYELNEQNKYREIKGLLEAMEYFNLKEGLLLTYDQEETIEEKTKSGRKVKINVKPVWKWLLEN